MSVLIKGMEMPKACEWCSFISTFTTESGLGCRCEVESFEFWDYSKRQENCPLVEVPAPHGRLIDADRLLAVLKSMASTNESVPTTAVLELIDHQPVVLKAEVSE